MPTAGPVSDPAPLTDAARDPETARTPPTAPAASRCAACDAELTGAYCHACGERAAGTREESVIRVLGEAFQEAFSADGKLWRSLRALFRPGHLTAAYFNGRASRYLRPFRLFLVVNVVLFFLLGFLNQNPLVGELAMQRQALGFGVAEAADGTLAAWGGDPALFELAFNTRSRTLASTLIVLFIPMLAGMLSLAFGFGRGARHLVFATHVLAALIVFYVALVVVVIGLVAALGAEGVSGDVANWSLVAVVLSSTAAFIALGARRVYGVPRWRAWVGGTAISVVGLAASVMAYRVLLFWLTLWTLRLPPA